MNIQRRARALLDRVVTPEAAKAVNTELGADIVVAGKTYMQNLIDSTVKRAEEGDKEAAEFIRRYGLKNE